MSGPAPRKRFSFSLRFLLAWVLLTAALLGLSVFAYSHPPTFSTTQHPVNVEVIRHDKIWLSGWPLWALRRVERSDIALPYEKDFMIPDAELADEQRATEVGRVNFVEYHPAGIAVNLLLCVVISGAFCGSARVLFKRRVATPTVLARTEP